MPFPFKSLPEVKVVAPVPPLPTDTVPETPPDGAAQLAVPAPLLVKTCPALPAVFGYVMSFNVKVPVVFTFVIAVVGYETSLRVNGLPSAPN